MDEQQAPASTRTIDAVAQLRPNASTQAPARMLPPWAILSSPQTSTDIELPASPPFGGRIWSVDMSGEITSPMAVFVMRSCVHSKATLSKATPHPLTNPMTTLFSGQMLCQVGVGCGERDAKVSP